MKKTMVLFSCIILLCSVSSYAQKRDTAKNKESDKHQMVHLIRQRLGVDSIKAARIEKIQATYKTDLAKVSSTAGLTIDQKRRMIDSLARIKNAQLLTILTPEQQAKIIPTTELKKNNQKGNKKP